MFFLQKERNKKFKLLAFDPNNKIIFATPNVINSPPIHIGHI
jgi:hypothetical protein